MATVRFFCSPSEELQLLNYLATDGALCWTYGPADAGHLPLVQADGLPSWDLPLKLYIWAPRLGPLEWFEMRPEMRFSGSHAQLLEGRNRSANVYLGPGQRLLDEEKSPVLVYTRGQLDSGDPTVALRSSCQLRAPVSKPITLSADYNRWVNKCLGWVRRRGSLVHNHRQRHRTLPNPQMIVSAFYALPEARADIDSGESRWRIG